MAGLEVFLHLGKRNFPKGFLILLPVVDESLTDVGEDHEGFGAGDFGKDGGTEVLVNDSLDALDVAVIVNDWDATAARANDDEAVIDEAFDCILFDEGLGNWGWDNDTPATASVFDHVVALFLLHLLGNFFGVKLADWLGWLLEGWVLWIDVGLGDDGNDFLVDAFLPEGGVELLLDHFTEEALGHGAADVEGHGWDRWFAVNVLEEDSAALGAVAVGDNEIGAVLDELDELSHGESGCLLLVFEGALLATLKESVTAECNDNAHVKVK